MRRIHHPSSSSPRRRSFLLSSLHAAVVGLALVATGCSGGEEGTGDGGGGGGSIGQRGPGSPSPFNASFNVSNDSGFGRTETIRASVPFPEGFVQDINSCGVDNYHNAWLPLQHWPDGSVRLAQAQFTAELQPGETQTLHIVKDVAARTDPFVRHPQVERIGGSQLRWGGQVVDHNGVIYEAFGEGQGETLNETSLIRTRRQRVHHEVIANQGPSIGRDFLTSTFYITEFAEQPFMYVDWIVGNDYRGIDEPGDNTDPDLFPLGPVTVQSARFLVRGVSACLPYKGPQHGISAQQVFGDNVMFETMQNTFMEDGQTRRYRFLLLFQDAAAPVAEQEALFQTAVAAIEDPMLPLATWSAWNESGALGLLGGPMEGPANAKERATQEFESFRNKTEWFGTWGRHGDVKFSHTTGTPRNGPFSPELGHAIQGEYPRLLNKLEQMAWIQAARPYHLYGLEIGARQDIYLWEGIPSEGRQLSRETLGRRPLWGSNDPYSAYRPPSNRQYGHGWNHYDIEHFSMDLLFDYWCVTGDEWAKEEIRQQSESLKGVMRLERYLTGTKVTTARAEGWCMQAFVQGYLATGDASLKDYATARLNEVIIPYRVAHVSKTLVWQGSHALTTYPGDHEFFMPWQHGGVLYGYLGAYKHFQEPGFLTICEDIPTMLEYSWVRNKQHPVHGLITEGLRYYVPITSEGSPISPDHFDYLPRGAWIGSRPLGGVHSFLVGGLYHLAEMTTDQTVYDKTIHYADLLTTHASANSRWDKWFFATPEYMLPAPLPR